MAHVIDVFPTPLVDPEITNLGIVNLITCSVFYLNGFNMTEDGFVIVYTGGGKGKTTAALGICLLYTSPSPRDGLLSRMPSSA